MGIRGGARRHTAEPSGALLNIDMASLFWIVLNSFCMSCKARWYATLNAVDFVLNSFQSTMKLFLQVSGGGLPSGLSSAARQSQSSAHARTSSSHSSGAVSAGASATAKAAAALQHQTLTEQEEVPSLAGTKRGPKQASPPGSPSPQVTKRPKLGAAAASQSSQFRKALLSPPPSM